MRLTLSSKIIFVVRYRRIESLKLVFSSLECKNLADKNADKNAALDLEADFERMMIQELFLHFHHCHLSSCLHKIVLVNLPSKNANYSTLLLSCLHTGFSTLGDQTNRVC